MRRQLIICGMHRLSRQELVAKRETKEVLHVVVCSLQSSHCRSASQNNRKHIERSSPGMSSLQTPQGSGQPPLLLVIVEGAYHFCPPCLHSQQEADVAQ